MSDRTQQFTANEYITSEDVDTSSDTEDQNNRTSSIHSLNSITRTLYPTQKVSHNTSYNHNSQTSATESTTVEVRLLVIHHSLMKSSHTDALPPSAVTVDAEKMKPSVFRLASGRASSL